jgi:drug/metabolite transporter (DMT)-like permease
MVAWVSKNKMLRSDGLLLLTAVIWGFAFVAQRVGMDHVGPFTFNGVRFALGALAMVPALVLFEGRQSGRRRPAASPWVLAGGGVLAGLALFAGASFQQVGLVYTTAGNAGFITGLYVVIVPILGLLWGQRSDAGTWGGVLLAAAGLYLLSVTDRLDHRLRRCPRTGWSFFMGRPCAPHRLAVAAVAGRQAGPGAVRGLLAAQPGDRLGD